jgi:hypothetical protein
MAQEKPQPLGRNQTTAVVPAQAGTNFRRDRLVALFIVTNLTTTTGVSNAGPALNLFRFGQRCFSPTIRAKVRGATVQPLQMIV